MHNPLEQFKIQKLFDISVMGYDISFTNSSFMLMLMLIASYFLFCFRVSNSSLIPSRLQIVREMFYGLITNMVKDTAGDEAKKYIPFIFTLFIFILVCNSLGMFPYAFTVTSHIAVTFAMAAFIFVSVTVIGFARHGFHYLSLFLPSGTPIFMAPLMIFTEIFAYFVRPVSLSLRLAANMTAGHIVLKVIASFVAMMLTAGLVSGVASVLPFSLLVLLMGFELFVAILQAYIFTILTCIYLTDAIKLH